MILVRLMGGLGNQMFQYAFGRALSLKYDTELVLDTTLLGDRSIPNEVATHRHFELDIFKNLKYRLATEKEVVLYNGDPKANVIRKAGRKVRSLLAPKKLVVQKNNEIDVETFDDACYVGRWQSYKFFDENKEAIRKDLELDKPSIEEINEMVDLISSCNSVCIHVRRADLVTSSLYSKTIGALDLSYYEKAISEVEDKVDDPVFFVFSDDLAWCREHITTLHQLYLVENDTAGKKAEGHLYLMTKCKHFIISNSTFSWWGAFLSESKNKQVIYPLSWFKDEALKNPQMSPLEWTGI